MNNRELKFRAWITPWGGDSQPYMKYIEDLQLHVYFGNWERGGYKDAVFQQYTGLKDKNGIPIFEGDIVAEKLTEEMAANGDSATVGMVYFAAGTFMIDGDGPLYDHVFSASPDILEDYIVIGNVLENKELLNQ
jgi:uncharacterized phage protein (TIGR01671 family)